MMPKTNTKPIYMNLERMFEGIEFANEIKRDEDVEKKVKKTADLLGLELENEIVLGYLRDPDLFKALPQEIQDDEKKLAEIVNNSTKFFNLIAPERKKRWDNDPSGLFGEKMDAPSFNLPNGGIRKKESGYKINVEYLKKKKY